MKGCIKLKRERGEAEEGSQLEMNLLGIMMKGTYYVAERNESAICSLGVVLFFTEDLQKRSYVKL